MCMKNMCILIRTFVFQILYNKSYNNNKNLKPYIQVGYKREALKFKLHTLHIYQF